MLNTSKRNCNSDMGLHMRKPVFINRGLHPGEAQVANLATKTGKNNEILQADLLFFPECK